METLRRILCVRELTDPGDDALRYAIALATEHGAELCIIHVSESDQHKVPDRDDVSPAQEGEQWLPLPVNVDPAVECEHLYRKGVAADEILSSIREKQIDHVVIGAHGHPGHHRVERGDMSERIVREAPCAVTVVGGKDAPQ